jgi:FAD/FMN-containing dehydrogenase
MAAMARATGWMPANVLRPFQVGNARTSHDGPSRRYMNFLDADEGTRVHDAYGDATYERLAEIKAKYDPDNVFHHNQNIRPAGRTS